MITSKQPKLGLTQELFFSRICESTTGYTFTPCMGSFTSPGIDTRQKRSFETAVVGTPMSVSTFVSTTVKHNIGHEITVALQVDEVPTFDVHGDANSL